MSQKYGYSDIQCSTALLIFYSYFVGWKSIKIFSGDKVLLDSKLITEEHTSYKENVLHLEGRVTWCKDWEF